jgi:DNA (cytosine-5)-methyltransferase 3A
MNVLSLFDGMSCGQIALNRVGIKYDNYFASEIDKHAIKVTQHNYPNTIQLGDVTQIKGSDLPKIDLLIGGSPCQGFSFAGKQLNFEDPRSKLFFEFVRLKNETNPKYFFLENVKMKKEYQNIISNSMGVEPIEIDSNLLSAQNRRRLYWTNIPMINSFISKDIYLEDVIIDDFIEDGLNLLLNKPPILTAKNGKKVYIDYDIKPPYTFYEARTEEGKEIRRRIRQETGRDTTPRTKDYKKYIPLNKGKANCILTIESPLDYIVDKNWIYRKLQVIEMERLQNVPDGYTSIVLPQQARKLLGNGWTVDIVAHFFSQINSINE